MDTAAPMGQGGPLLQPSASADTWFPASHLRQIKSICQVRSTLDHHEQCTLQPPLLRTGLE